MRRIERRQGIVIAAGLLVAALPSLARAGDEQLVEEGKKVYDRYCVICHGAKGDGKGLIGVVHRAQKNGVVVTIYPRDFTAGMFKFRSTPTGSLPTDEDLLRTVTGGVARSGMPSHADVPLESRKAVIAYVKTFSPKWAEYKPAEPIKIDNVPDYVGTPESVKAGKELFTDAGCVKCHGAEGRGDGESADGLKDNWGDKIVPFDFTSGPLKGGTGAKEIYRTFVTGMDGTPMPSFADVLEEKQKWDVVSYCLELMKQGPGPRVAAK
ncbi:MAG: c-type cytochrome [Deltaproteobacteria bacterium]|nr:c-type cytochrome [Deltaproteobacteria bacterium]